MKKGLLLVCGLLIALSCTRPVIRPSAPELKPLHISRIGFQRGLWVRGVSVASPDSIARIITIAQRLGITDIYVQAVVAGYAYYNSTVLPRSQYLAEISEEEYDPLAALIRAAHKRSIRVHAWVNALLVWSLKDPPDSLRHVIYTHPEWFITNANKRSITDYSHKELNDVKLEGYYLDPSHQEVQTYLASICEEIVTHYPVASIQLDFIRYPGALWGLPEYDGAALFAGNGTTPRWMTLTRYPQLPFAQRWLAWHYWRINKHKESILFETVRQVREAIGHALYPQCGLTAAVFAHPGTARYQFAQNWMDWEEVIDFPVIMSYTQDVDLFASYVHHARMHRPDAIYGIGLLWPDMEAEVYYQVNYVRRMNGAGVSFFDFTAVDTMIDFEKFKSAHKIPYDSLYRDTTRYDQVQDFFVHPPQADYIALGSHLLVPGEALSFCAFLLSLTTDARRDFTRMNTDQWQFLEKVHDDVAAFKFLDSHIFPLGDTLIEPPFWDIAYTYSQSNALTHKAMNSSELEKRMKVYENSAEPLAQVVSKTEIGERSMLKSEKGTFIFEVKRISAGGGFVERNDIQPDVLPLFLNWTIKTRLGPLLEE